MPELPEVETMCRGIAGIVGSKIFKVVDPGCTYRQVQCDPDLDAIHTQLKNQPVHRVYRIGKRVIIEAGDHALILQPKMTGLVAIDDVPSLEHVRLEIYFRGGPVNRVLFWDRRGLGTIQMLHADEVEKRLVDGKLGPDALVISEQEFAERLKATRRPIKVALLDQKILAGVGNLYASEMLHAAKVHPETPSAEVTRKQFKLLHQAMLRILNTAIDNEGSTLSDGTYRNALNQDGGYQNQHLVYDRAEEDCKSCRKATIIRIVQAQRSTFYCPRCQKK